MASVLRLHVASRTALRQSIRSPFLTQRRGLLTLKDKAYTATATASGAGRNGNVIANDGTATPLDLKLSMPQALGGKGDGVNPEQLFASGYSACFLGALQAVAREQGKSDLAKNATITAEVHIGPPMDLPGFGIAVDLTVSGVTDEGLVEAAHEFCPYSRALKHGVQVNVTTA